MTKLLYLEDFSKLDCDASVLEVTEKDGKIAVILDQTILYPQGGGQAFDKGEIQSSSMSFRVDEVRMFDDVVWHFGSFANGIFQTGDMVQCVVDEVRRTLNSRIHSAGHVIDAVLEDMGLNWIPGRGYHFPEGPFVEYQGELGNLDPGSFQKDLELKCNEYIRKNVITRVEFMDQDTMERTFKFQPKALSESQKARIIYFGDFGIPCGGTHVSNGLEIGNMTIKKVKQHHEIVRIAYDVAR